SKVRGVEAPQVRFGLDECAVSFRHLPAIDGQKSVNVDLGRKIETGRLQHGWPEQRVKVLNVLANEMMNFRFWISPPRVKILTAPLAPLESGSHVSNGGVIPHEPIVAGEIGNLKSPVRGGT